MKLLLNIDDIENLDNKTFNVQNLKLGEIIVDNSDNFYFYDQNYNCIRVVQKKQF